MDVEPPDGMPFCLDDAEIRTAIVRPVVGSLQGKLPVQECRLSRVGPPRARQLGLARRGVEGEQKLIVLGTLPAQGRAVHRNVSTAARVDSLKSDDPIQ